MKDNALVHWFPKEKKTLQMLKLLPVKQVIHKEQERAQNLLISLSNYPTLAAFTSSFDHEHHASLMLYASFQLILSPKGQCHIQCAKCWMEEEREEGDKRDRG